MADEYRVSFGVNENVLKFIVGIVAQFSGYTKIVLDCIFYINILYISKALAKKKVIV